MSKPQPLFPVTLTATWLRDYTAVTDAGLKDWLLDPSSLTARLKRHSHTFHVQLLGQTVEQCQPHETFGDIVSGESILVREVLLFCNEQPQVFARSLLPLRSLTGEQQQLAHLGTQPLGQVLFNDPLLRREAIEIACFKPHSTVVQLAQHLALETQAELWGRRSLFTINHKPLIVAEVFLPGAFAYQSTVQ